MNKLFIHCHSVLAAPNIYDTSADEQLLASLPLSILMLFFVRKIAMRCKTFFDPTQAISSITIITCQQLATYELRTCISFICIVCIVLICPCKFARGQQQDSQLPPRPPLHPVYKASEIRQYQTLMQDILNMCLCLLAPMSQIDTNLLIPKRILVYQLYHLNGFRVKPKHENLHFRKAISASSAPTAASAAASSSSRTRRETLNMAFHQRKLTENRDCGKSMQIRQIRDRSRIEYDSVFQTSIL